ncbi:hypothetical protein R1flu_022091 [Riccia fluitans]|uniref:Uncharacterized protein n=1 Tax=Riccia fluitans TaxID=41844 RepID=A0ABD1ZR95_9MARC
MAILESLAIDLELSRSISEMHTESDRLNEGPTDETAKPPSHFHNHVIEIVAVEEEVEQIAIASTSTTSSCGSILSDDTSEGNFCRICQQHSEEAVVELGYVLSPQRPYESWIWGAGGPGRAERPAIRNSDRPVIIPSEEAAQDKQRSAALLILTVLLFFDGLMSIMLRGTPLAVKISVVASLISGFIATARLAFLEVRSQHLRRNLRMISAEAQAAQSTPGVTGS